MANVLTANPWVVDTASATAVFSSEIKVRHMEFVAYAAATDKVIVTDKNGILVWQGDGNADLESERSGNIGWVNGLIVSTLTSGKLLVYID